MRIGIDYTAAARQGAGIGRYARELITALLALESEHQYVLFAGTGGLARAHWKKETARLRALSAHRPASGLRFRTLPLSDDWLARLWQRLRLPIPVEAITGRVDVFYSPDFVLPPTRRATRTLLTVHDLSFLHHPGAYVPSLLRYLESAVPRSVARADRLLADSEATRADLVGRYGVPPEKVDVLYSGVDARFRPEGEPGERARLQERYGVGDGPYVLSVGTLQPRKNYVRLMRAFDRLAGLAIDQPPARLVIGGGRGWLCEEILAEAGRRAGRVRLPGFVEDADLPALYRNAALFSFPSLYEGFGLPVLEAMACGVPVVCSNGSSLPEVAGDAALLVDPHDVDGLAEAMARALADGELRRQMVARGLDRAAEFTWERAARQLLDNLAPPPIRDILVIRRCQRRSTCPD